MITLTPAQHTRLDKLADTHPNAKVIGHDGARPIIQITATEHRVLHRNGTLRQPWHPRPARHAA